MTAILERYYAGPIPAHRAPLMRAAAAATGVAVEFGSTIGKIPIGDWTGIYLPEGERFAAAIRSLWTAYETAAAEPARLFAAAAPHAPSLAARRA